MASLDKKSSTERSITSHTPSSMSEYDPEKNASTRTDTEVEQIAERIEKRRAARILVTFKSRVRFLKDCRRIARDNGYDQARISRQDVVDYRDRVVEHELKAGLGINNSHFFHHILGIKSDVQCLAKILERAVDNLHNDEIDTDGWLYYKDFSFDHTRVVSRWPVVRHPLGIASLVVFLYYLATPILFCFIMPSSNICDTGRDGYMGWVNALYFASTTVRSKNFIRSIGCQMKWRSCMATKNRLTHSSSLCFSFVRSDQYCWVR